MTMANGGGGPFGRMRIFRSGNDDREVPVELQELLKALTREDPDPKESAVKKDPPLEVPSVGKVTSYLDERVIGQQQAKEAVGIAIHKHYLRAALQQQEAAGNAEPDDVQIEKSNVLLIGDTGTGKTLIAETAAKMVDVPFVAFDATNLTPASHAGGINVDTIISKLLQAAGGDVKRAERGIIYIDEIDKLAGHQNYMELGAGGRGNRSTEIQQALLKIIEGTVVSVSPSGGIAPPVPEFMLPEEMRPVKIDTRNVLFVCSGAFDGLADIVRERRGEIRAGGGKRIGGFLAAANGADKGESPLKAVIPADLKKYGLLPELIGRLPVVAATDPLTTETLVRIMTEPRNAIVKQFKKQLKMSGAELVFEPAALTKIAERALAYGQGARSLRSVLERVLRQPTIDASNNLGKIGKIVVTADSVDSAVPTYVVPNTSIRTVSID